MSRKPSATQSRQTVPWVLMADIRQWWQELENGTVQFAVRYGTKPLEMRTGLAAVEVAKLADLPAMIKTLIAAVQAGELDTQMAMAAVGRKPKLR
jgi:hypothetical protein